MANKTIEQIEPTDTDLTEIRLLFLDGALQSAQATSTVRIVGSSATDKAAAGVARASLPQPFIDDAESFIPGAITVIKNANGF